MRSSSLQNGQSTACSAFGNGSLQLCHPCEHISTSHLALACCKPKQIAFCKGKALICAARGLQYYKPFAERLGRDAANRRLVQAVDAMKPRINNSAPTRYSHLTNNRKRRSMAEGAPPASVCLRS